MATLAGGRHDGVCLLHDDSRARTVERVNSRFGLRTRMGPPLGTGDREQHELVAGGMRSASRI